MSPQYADKNLQKESTRFDVERCNTDDGQRPAGKLIKAVVLFIIFIGLGRPTGKAIAHHLHQLVRPKLVAPTNADIHPSVALAHCTNWSTPRAEFTLPLNSASFRFLSHHASTGSFHLVQDLNPEDNSRVEVLPTDPGSKSLQQVRVCASTRPQASEHTIFIAPPRDLVISFNVTLRLPKPAHEGSKIYINSLNLDLQLFTHTIADIGPTVEFGTISLKTGAGDLPVTVQSLSAAKAYISTTNSHLSGNFSVGEDLLLSTTNGKISANVVLENNMRKRRTGLIMMSQGAPIEASIALRSSTPDSPISNKYFVNANTRFSPISLTFLPSPSLTPPTLLLTALTAHAPLTITLPPTYRGEYSVSTSTDTPTLQPQVVVVNGKGRILDPLLERKRRMGEVGGAVWDEGRFGVGKGVVKVRTEFAPAVLII